MVVGGMKTTQLVELMYSQMGFVFLGNPLLPPRGSPLKLTVLIFSESRLVIGNSLCKICFQLSDGVLIKFFDENNIIYTFPKLL